MKNVKNFWNVEINFESAVALMDKDLCEEIDSENEQEFFDAYCKAHEEKYGEEFELAKENPVW